MTGATGSSSSAAMDRCHSVLDPAHTDLRNLIANVERGEDGVWRASSHARVSYPDEGHDSCYGVEDDSFWFAHRNRCIAATILNDPPDRTLPFADIGGGNGYVAQEISSPGFRVILIEPGSSGIAHARARGLDELVMASIVDLDVAPGAFGAIGLFDVLEHIEDDAAALRSLHSMLADGGKVYATVPAHSWLWSSVDTEAGHFRRYTRDEVHSLLTRCGFDVGLCSYYFWPLPLPMFLLRSLPEILHLHIGNKNREQRVAAEHGKSYGVLELLLSKEERLLRQGRRIPFGASCIVAATRRSNSDC